MSKKGFMTGLIFGALASMLMLFGVAYTSASQVDAQTAQAATQLFAGGERDFSHRGGPGQRPGGGDNGEALASELGLTVEELEAAQEAVKTQLVEQAVADGVITQEQADAILSGEGRGFGGPRGDRGFNGDRDAAESLLAAELGITVEELEAAREAVREAALAEALENGTITQEQIDLMEAREALKEYIDRDQLMADVLGISVEELQSAKEDGTLRELIEGLELDPETVRENMEAAMSAAVDQAVEDGVITAEQAEQLEEAPAGRGHGRGGPRGEGRGFGGPRGGGEQPAPTDTNA